MQRTLLIILAFLFLLGESVAQEGKPYVSFAGGFEINLPAQTDGYNSMGSGFRLSWRNAEAEYEIGFHERQGLPLAHVEGSFSYEEAVRRYFNKFSTAGERLYSKAIVLRDHSGFEYKYRTPNSVFLLRLFLVGDRVYQLLAQVAPGNEAGEKTAARVFDSFRLISKDDVANHFSKQIADATPASLPQTPRVPKVRSDVQDRSLKGNVRSAMTESASFAINDTLKQRHPRTYQEFDSDGYLIKEIEYDNNGNPMRVTVYGYIAGKRVARKRSIEQEGMIIGGIEIPGLKPSRFDRRFDEYYSYRYLNGSLIEERNYWSNGVLYGRSTYRYQKNSKTTDHFDGGTRPFRRVVAELDDLGNEIKLTAFEPDRGKFIGQAPYSITYNAFDNVGNWTQRTISRWYGLDGKGKTFREYVEYRTIEYYR